MFLPTHELEAPSHVTYRQMCGTWVWVWDSSVNAFHWNEASSAATLSVRCWPNLLLIGNTALVSAEQRCWSNFPKLSRDWRQNKMLGLWAFTIQTVSVRLMKRPYMSPERQRRVWTILSPSREAQEQKCFQKWILQRSAEHILDIWEASWYQGHGKVISDSC